MLKIPYVHVKCNAAWWQLATPAALHTGTCIQQPHQFPCCPARNAPFRRPARAWTSKHARDDRTALIAQVQCCAFGCLALGIGAAPPGAYWRTPRRNLVGHIALRSVLLTTRRAQSAATGHFDGNFGSAVPDRLKCANSHHCAVRIRGRGVPIEMRCISQRTNAALWHHRGGGFWPPILTSIGIV